MALRGWFARRPSDSEVREANREQLHEIFEGLGPWFTRFDVKGEGFGGSTSYEEDDRVDLFFKWIGRPATILELSSFEGGHSVRLAAPPFVERLVGLEGRWQNIERARFVADLLGPGNIEFFHADLDREGLGRFGRFDAVFCAGLLYHLTRPWHLIEEIAKVTDRLFLDTHYSEHEEETVDGYVGRVFKERSGTLSGLSKSAFWLTLPCLTETLDRAGFTIRHQDDKADWWGDGPRIRLAAFKR